MVLLGRYLFFGRGFYGLSVVMLCAFMCSSFSLKALGCSPDFFYFWQQGW